MPQQGNMCLDICMRHLSVGGGISCRWPSWHTREERVIHTSSGVGEGLSGIVFEDECFLQVHVFQYLADVSVLGPLKGRSLLEEVLDFKQALRFYNFSPLPVPLLCFLCVGEMWSADPMHILVCCPHHKGSTFEIRESNTLFSPKGVSF